MAVDPDAFDFDYERSRAAVAVACLQWLRCTGPAIDLETPRDSAEVPRDSRPIEDPIPSLDFSPHPLWDRWLDG